MNSKVFSAYSREYADPDLEELELPKYVDHLEPTEEKPKQNLRAFIEDIWVPQPELVEKSLEQLEQEDLIYRNQLLLHNDSEKKKSQQLLLQRDIYKDLLEFGIKIFQLPSFSSVSEYRKNLRKLIKSLVKIQTALLECENPRFKEIPEFLSQTWDRLAELAREWSSRVDLKIGADIIEQVLREAEKKSDSDIKLFLLRELKSESEVQVRTSKKKTKHKFSKHRKLKFDVHEKLLNFMTPETVVWDSKKENLINSLFGRKVETSEKIYLDIPLV